jgi:hypothetical protein
MDTRELREQWESLNGAIIDDAYDGTGVLNRPNRGSVVIMSKEDCDEIVADHNQVLDALRAENERLRDALEHTLKAIGSVGISNCNSCIEAARLLENVEQSTQPAPDQKGKL